jgi:hypothetical protein
MIRSLSMEKIEDLLKDIPIPRMIKVRQNFKAPEIKDTAAAVRHAIFEADVLSRIKEGDRVAIAVGSRGVADIPIIVRETVKAVKSVDAFPFIVPAMGSHGGATAEGQIQVLKDLGVTEEYVLAPIHSSMSAEEIGKLDNGLGVFVDSNAFHADKIIVINRIKQHTAFDGPVESGLMKMITIGLGKRKGADSAHKYGFGHMAKHVPEMARMVLSKVPIIFGLATIENAYDRPAKVAAIPAEKIEETEQKLLLEAKSLMPRLLINKMNVLVIDEVGKDISGSGMDPQMTGRYPTPFKKNTTGTEAGRIVILGLTKKTHGNANGIGFADIITRKVFDEIEWEKGYFNAITSTVVNAVKVPMFLRTEKLAVQAGIKTSNVIDLNQVRVVRIKNTLDVKEIWISESLLPEAKEIKEIDILSEPEEMVLACD